MTRSFCRNSQKLNDGELMEATCGMAFVQSSYLLHCNVGSLPPSASSAVVSAFLFYARERKKAFKHKIKLLAFAVERTIFNKKRKGLGSHFNEDNTCPPLTVTVNCSSALSVWHCIIYLLSLFNTIIRYGNVLT